MDFQRVHRLDGICGDPIVDVPFAWRDDAPPEVSKVYYRIALGIEGHSSVKSVNLVQFSGADHRFFPSPMKEQATLLLDVASSAQVELFIFDASGKLLLERSGLKGREHQIVLRDAAPGVYLYLALAEGQGFSGRFVKE